MIRATSAAVLAVSLLALGACSNDSALTDATTAAPTTAGPATTAAQTDGSGETTAPVDPVPPNGETVDVQAIDNTFRPEQLEISAGTEVVWTNVGRNEHNIVPVDGGDWGIATEDFAPKAVYSHVFSTPGTYAYYCSIHGTGDIGMIGTVVVTG